jgi:hypothetical protein
MHDLAVQVLLLLLSGTLQLAVVTVGAWRRSGSTPPTTWLAWTYTRVQRTLREPESVRRYNERRTKTHKT